VRDRPCSSIKDPILSLTRRNKDFLQSDIAKESTFGAALLSVSIYLSYRVSGWRSSVPRHPFHSKNCVCGSIYFFLQYPLLAGHKRKIGVFRFEYINNSKFSLFHAFSKATFLILVNFFLFSQNQRT
jgi:hypothetical protein